MSDGKMSGGMKALIGCAAGCGGLMALGMIGFIVLAMMAPEDNIVAGSQMPSEQVQTLKSIGALNDDEQIVYFYTVGLMDITEGGSFFTDKRVVNYIPVGETGHHINEASYEEITAINPTWSTSWIDNTIFTIEKDDGTFFDLEVTALEQADKRFHQRLLKEWSKHGGGESGE